MSERRCIGFGDFEDICGRVLNEDDLALNAAGLWCERCERLRRVYISEQFATLTASFSTTDGPTP